MVPLGIRPADHNAGDVLLARKCRDSLEVARQGQVRERGALKRGHGPPPVCDATRLGLRLCPADVGLGEPRLTEPACRLERLDEARARRHTDQSIAEASGGLGAAGRAGDEDGWRRLGPRVETRVVDREVVAAVAVDLAAPELRMRSTASSSIASRTSAGGQSDSTTCSFNRSPEPTPRKKRPGMRVAVVAAA